MSAQARLITAIAASKRSVEDARDALRHINEPQWQDDFGALLDQIDRVRRVHGEMPQPSIADDYANLAGLLRQIRFSEEDQDRERYRTLRGALGGLLEDAREILDCAAQMGLRPAESAEPLPNTAMLETAGREGQLIALQQRITSVETMLTDRLLPEAEAGKPREQAAIVTHYVQDMRRYTTSIRLSISIGDGIDLAVIERAASAMARATVAMIDTVRARASKATQGLRDSVAAIGKPVKKLIGGVRVLVQIVRRSDARQGKPAPPSPLPDDYLEQAGDMILAGQAPPPLPDDFRYQAEEMILDGNNVPENWIPHIDKLNFKETNLSSLESLIRFSALRNLDISSTKVSDLAPIANLISLKELNISYTDIIDLSPVSQLENLVDLSFQSKKIHDLEFITNLSSLKSLTIISGELIDLTPLSKLNNLEDISFFRTSIVNILPLANLKHLNRLYFYKSNVSDLTPLSNLNTLRHLALDETEVRSLAPLSNMQKLTIQVDSLNFRILRPTIRSGATVKVVRE